ncbi:MAG: class I SAM-dependent methyltransferase [Burkholderiales bacterium]
MGSERSAVSIKKSLDGLDWDTSVRGLDPNAHYLDAFLGDLKRRVHIGLIERWGALPKSGLVLKTDLFEEALGPDAYLADLSKEEAMVIGLDISPVAAGKARVRFPACSVIAADVRSLPFGSGSFALIVSPSTLDHFPNPADLNCSLRELVRVLEPGGRLIITLDNRQNIFDPLLRLAHWLGLVPYYLGRSYTVHELREELERAGLVVQETTAILHNPRLTAVAMIGLVKRLRWNWLTRLVRRALIALQRLEKTRLRYYTGSFVAAKAVRPR